MNRWPSTESLLATRAIVEPAKYDEGHHFPLLEARQTPSVAEVEHAEGN